MVKWTPEQWLKREFNGWKKFVPEEARNYVLRRSQEIYDDISSQKIINSAPIGGVLSLCGGRVKYEYLCYRHGNKRPVNWAEVRRAIAYEYWGTRMCYLGYQQQLAEGKDRDFNDIYRNITGLVAFALYNDDEALLADMLPRLTALADRSLPIKEKFWTEFLFSPALIKLAGRLKGIPVPPAIAARDCGVCDAPLRTANDPAAFAEAMRALADHYVMRMVDRAGTLWLEFQGGIGRSIPYAFWAFMRLRPDATSDHLLATWLGPPPKFTVSDYSDDLIEACRKRWPEA